jgi:putative transposase
VSLRTICAWDGADFTSGGRGESRIAGFFNIESQWEHYKRQLAQNSPVETTHITETLGSSWRALTASRLAFTHWGGLVGWDDDTRSRRYAGYRFPAEIISHAVWLYFRFPLGLRMVEELLAARGIIVSHETVRQWALKFGQPFANQVRRRLPRVGDKWHLDEVALKIAGVKHWLWRAVDQTGIVLDVLVQRRRDKQAAKRLLRKLLEKQRRPPRVMITDKLASYGEAKREVMPGIQHRQQRAEQTERRIRTSRRAVESGK